MKRPISSFGMPASPRRAGKERAPGRGRSGRPCRVRSCCSTASRIPATRSPFADTARRRTSGTATAQPRAPTNSCPASSAGETGPAPASSSPARPEPSHGRRDARASRSPCPGRRGRCARSARRENGAPTKGRAAASRRIARAIPTCRTGAPATRRRSGNVRSGGGALANAAPRRVRPRAPRVVREVRKRGAHDRRHLLRRVARAWAEWVEKFGDSKSASEQRARGGPRRVQQAECSLAVHRPLPERPCGERGKELRHAQKPGMHAYHVRQHRGAAPARAHDEHRPRLARAMHDALAFSRSRGGRPLQVKIAFESTSAGSRETASSRQRCAMVASTKTASIVANPHAMQMRGP